MLTADEVSRSLQGSFRLLNRDARGLRDFDVSVAAFWRSFAAFLLTAPALVVGLAGDRLALGYPPEEGLFSAPDIVAHEVLLAVAGWIAFPLAMIAVVRWLRLGHRYVGFIIAWNWSAVVAAFVMAVPKGLQALDLATPGLALLYGAAFSIVILQYRWFTAKAALGVSGGVAALVVLLDLCLNGVVVETVSHLV
jgi:hypothetical protein